MDALFELHSRRWQARGAPGAFAFEKVRRLHREFAVLAAERGWLRLTVMEVEGAPISVLKAVEINGVRYVHLNGFDPDYKSLSPGAIVYGHTIRAAIEAGTARVDFMTGDTEFKRQWRPQQTISNVGWQSKRPGWRGNAACAWYETILPRAIHTRRQLRTWMKRVR